MQWKYWHSGDPVPALSEFLPASSGQDDGGGRGVKSVFYHDIIPWGSR